MLTYLESSASEHYSSANYRWYSITSPFRTIIPALSEYIVYLVDLHHLSCNTFRNIRNINEYFGINQPHLTEQRRISDSSSFHCTLLGSYYHTFKLVCTILAREDNTFRFTFYLTTGTIVENYRPLLATGEFNISSTNLAEAQITGELELTKNHYFIQNNIVDTNNHISEVVTVFEYTL